MERSEHYRNLLDRNLQIVKEKAKLKHLQLFKKDLFSELPVAAIILDEEGVIVDVNDKFCRLLGYGRDELKNTRYTCYLHVDYIEKTEALREDYKDPEVVEEIQARVGFMKNVFITKEGKELPLYWYSKDPVKVGDFTVSFCVDTLHFFDILHI